MRAHDPDCDYHADQNEHECTCILAALRAQVNVSLALMERLGFDEQTKADCTAQAMNALEGKPFGNVRSSVSENGQKQAGD